MKPSLMKRPGIFLICAVLLAAAAAGGEYSGQARFSPGDLTFETVAGCDLPALGGAGTTTRVGAPALPCVQVNVALPVDAVVAAVRAAAGETLVLDGSFDVLPFAAPRHYGSAPAGSPFIRDRAVYGSDAFWPGVHAEVTGRWKLAGQDFVTLTLYPLQYNPVSRRLVLAESISFEVIYDEPAGAVRETFNFSERVRAQTLKKLMNAAVNPEDVLLPPWNGQGSRTLPPGDYEYVIIGPDGYQGDWAALLTWMKKKGMPGVFASLDAIYANFTGYTDEEKIRNFFKEAHTAWGTVFFLLGGDTGLVPCKKTSINGDTIPNDTYYADYNADKVVDVFVGRACADNASQIQTFITLTLDYQKNPPADFGARIFFMGFDLDSYTKSELCKDYIYSTWVPSTMNFVREYDSEAYSHKSDCIGYLNDGQNLINHSDHCNQTVLGVGSYRHGQHLEKTDLAALTNGDKQGLFYSLGCWALAFDYNDAIGEKWTKDLDNAGLAFVGNSRYGWYSPGSTNSYSMRYDRKFWKVLFDPSYNAYRAGETLAESKNNYFPSDSTYRYIFMELTLMGDPALPLWTDEPDVMDVQFYPTIPTGVQNFPVKVTCGGGNLAGALVCIWKGTEVYERALTDWNGMVWFNNIDPAQPGTMDVTVTAQNMLPFEGACLVDNGGTPDVSVDLKLDSAQYAHQTYASYTVDMVNNTSASQTFSLWTNVTTPGGFTWPATGYLDGPEVITLAAGGTDQRSYSHFVAPFIPAGWYTMNAFVGPDPGVIDEDHETVQILP